MRRMTNYFPGNSNGFFPAFLAGDAPASLCGEFNEKFPYKLFDSIFPPNKIAMTCGDTGKNIFLSQPFGKAGKARNHIIVYCLAAFGSAQQIINLHGFVAGKSGL